MTRSRSVVALVALGVVRLERGVSLAPLGLRARGREELRRVIARGLLAAYRSSSAARTATVLGLVGPPVDHALGAVVGHTYQSGHRPPTYELKWRSQALAARTSASVSAISATRSGVPPCASSRSAWWATTSSNRLRTVRALPK